MSELTDLEVLNITIAKAEDDCNHEWLAGVLAPQFAFMRADGKTFDDRAAFLKKVADEQAALDAGAEPSVRTTEFEAIELVGDNRAVVRVVITKTSGATTGSFHNLRVFVKHGEHWRLLAWANEKLP